MVILSTAILVQVVVSGELQQRNISKPSRLKCDAETGS